jgi:hypothetical protein
MRKLLFQKFLQRGKHDFPVLFGMLLLLFGFVIVLLEQDGSCCFITYKLNCDGVIVFWEVWLT